MEAAEGARGITLPEVGPNPLQELDELRVGADVGPEPGNDAMVVGPEGTRVAWARPRAALCVVQLADACFHGRSVAAVTHADIRDRAALRCGELPSAVSRGRRATRHSELDVDLTSPRLVEQGGRRFGR